MVAPTTVAVQFKQLSYAEIGSQATVSIAETLNYASELSDDGNFFYWGDGGNDVHIGNITTRTAPTVPGTIGALDGLFLNTALLGMVKDSTGRYLYIANGNTSLYTVDLDTPSVPSVIDTLAISTAATDNQHVLLRSGDFLYLTSDGEFQKIDISTPTAPSIDTTITATTTIGSGLRKGAVTPDGNYILYPEEAKGSTAQIGIVDISGTPVEVTPVDLPQFEGGGGDVAITAATPIFDSAINSSRMWTVGRFNDAGATSYFWMVFENGEDWETLTLISDTITVGGSNGYLVPTTYLSNDPRDTFLHGTIDSEIILSEVGDITVQDTILSFWALDANEIVPQLVIKEGGHTTTEITDIANLQNVQVYDNSVIVSCGRKNLASGAVGLLEVFIPTEVEITDSGWQAISTDVLVEGIDVGYGITGDGVRDRVAQTGQMTIRLNNVDTVGQYSPDHASLTTGFVVGAPIRLQVDSKTKFLGRIESITPELNASNSRTVATIVTCVDSMDILSRAVAKGLTVRTSISADRIVELALAQATGLPITSNWTDALDSTSPEYAFAFDGVEDDETNLLAHIQSAAESERGFFYPAYQHDDVGSDGGFRFESRDARTNSPISSTSMDETLTGLIVVEHSADVVYNRVQARIFPRSQDSSPTTILFTLQNVPRLKPGESMSFTAPYSDPTEQASRVSGTDMQPPIGNTDYTFSGNEGGGGTNLTANLTAHVKFFGSSAEVTLSNAGEDTGYVSLFQLKGKGLYSYEPITLTNRDLTSIVQYGLSDVLINLPHESDPLVAAEVVDNVLAAYKDPRTFIRTVKILPSKSTAALNAFLDGEIGDKFFIENDVLGIDMGTSSPFILETSALDGSDELADADAAYVIHSIKFSIGELNHIEATWGLFPAEVRL